VIATDNADIMKNLLKKILPKSAEVRVGLSLAAAYAGLFMMAVGVKAINESRGYVYLPKEGTLDSRMAFRSEGSPTYNMSNVSFMATPRGGCGNYMRPLTLSESNLVNRIELEAK
jgi:hypothetical protein